MNRRTFIKFAANAQLKKENAKLRKTMELHAGDACSANNEAMTFKSQWDDAEERNIKLTKEIDRLNKLLKITQSKFDVAQATLLDLQRAMVEDYISPDEAQKLKVEAYNAGLSEFAWWKDGVQYVGTCGKLLKDHLKETPQSKANRKMKKKVYDPGSGYDENGNEYG